MREKLFFFSLFRPLQKKYTTNRLWPSISLCVFCLWMDSTFEFVSLGSKKREKKKRETTKEFLVGACVLGFLPVATRMDRQEHVLQQISRPLSLIRRLYIIAQRFPHCFIISNSHFLFGISFGFRSKSFILLLFAFVAWFIFSCGGPPKQYTRRRRRFSLTPIGKLGVQGFIFDVMCSCNRMGDLGKI